MLNFVIYCAFLVSVYCSINISRAESSEEAICNRFAKPTIWTCTKRSNCQWTMQLESQRRIVRCGFERITRHEKICCPHIPTDTSNSIDPVSKARQIARKKCREYDKYKFNNHTKVSSILGEPDIMISKLDCARIVTLIIGGTKALEKELPHMAVLGYSENIENIQWACGGSLISERYILSAAHCTKTDYYGFVKWASLGVINKLAISPESLGTNLFRIVQHFNHPEYKGAKYQDHDIAIYKLDRQIPLSPNIRPACLQTIDVARNSSVQTWAAGFGVTGAGEDDSDDLLKVSLDFVDNNLCIDIYKEDSKLRNGFDVNTMVCAGKLNDSKDTCSGDSGGPLQTHVPNAVCMWSLVGITSLGSSFCGDRTPAVYTKVSYYVPWIQKIVWPEFK